MELESLSGQSTFSPFSVQNDSAAGGGQYIVWPNNGSNQLLSAASDTATGQVAINFSLSQSTNVSFGITANMINGNDDSFYYKLDSSAWSTQNNTATTGWQSVSLATFNSLAAGNHTLRILRREDGAGLDRVTLTAATGTISSSGGGSTSSTSSSSNSSSSSSSSSSSGSTGANSVTVRMSGSVGDETVSLQIGGQTIQTWTIANYMADYSVNTNSTGELRVAFTNDSGDRDVQVDYVIVNGVVYQAEDQADNTGAYNGSCGGGSYTEMLHCSGSIGFGNPWNPNEPSCSLGSNFRWTSSAALVSPSQSNWASVKDPTIVQYNGLYHVFATVFDTSLNSWGSIYFNFANWSQANSAPQTYMRNTTMGNAVAPQVFYFRPHGLWYQITQWGGSYSTTSNISNPASWSAKRPLLSGEPTGSLDFWVICNDTHCYLYFSRDDGTLYMSKTTIGNFPNFSGYTTVMRDSRGANYLFEAANVYKVDGTNQYLLLVEAYISGPRFFRSWTSTSLDGPWTPLADTESNPFAGNNNVTWPNGQWANGISHGELIRSGYDERLTIDPCNLQFLYQGQAGTASEYSRIPYRLGLLTRSN